MRISQSLKKIYTNLSASKRAYLLYGIFVVFPMVIFLWHTIQFNNKQIEHEILNSYLQTLTQINRNLSYRLNEVETTSLNLLRDEDLYTYLLGSPGENSISKEIEDTDSLRKLAQDVQQSNDISKLRIYAKSKKIFTRDSINFFPFLDLTRSINSSEIISSNGSTVWTDAHIQNLTENQKGYVITCARMVRNPDNFDEFIAALLLDVPEKNICDIISNVGNGMENSIFLVSDSGKILSHTGKLLIGREISEINTRASETVDDRGILEFGKGIDRGYIIYCKQEIIGGTLLLIRHAASIAKEAREWDKLWFITTILVFLSFFAITVFVIMLSYVKRIDKKASELVMSMDKLQLGSKQNKNPANFSMLESSVNSLISRASDLIEEVYEEKLHAKDMQLRLLQAQINPHFLYNAIDTIYWMAIRRNAADVADMLSALAKYFRYSLNKGRDIVSIEDEIELANSYIRLQRARFPGRFSVEFMIDEQSKDFLIPKLSIQPLIENAVIHGILPMEEFGTITLSVQCLKNEIHFKVWDNGVGFKEEVDYQNYLNTGYGMSNVNQRLLFFNNNSNGITIVSKKGEGTTVSFSLLKRKN